MLNSTHATPVLSTQEHLGNSPGLGEASFLNISGYTSSSWYPGRAEHQSPGCGKVTQQTCGKVTYLVLKKWCSASDTNPIFMFSKYVNLEIIILGTLKSHSLL